MIKIAIPTANGQLCMHFGHCETFAIVTADAATQTILATESIVPPPHEPGVLPKWLGEQNVNLIIAGGMGQRAQSLFTQQGIKTIAGAPVESPENIVNSYLQGKLMTGNNACDH